MPNENEYLQDDVQVEEEMTSTESESQQDDGQEETITLSKSEFTKLKRQAFAYKATKDEPKQQKEAPALSQAVIEETILKAQGLTDELLTEMKALAHIRNKSLLEIQNDPIILAMKAEKDREMKERQAKLGASRSSRTNVEPKKSFNTPGLSKEEHKALWKERFTQN